MIDPRAVIAAVALSVIGAAGFLIMPVVLGAAVTEFGLSEREVGLLAALLMTGSALSAVSALFWVRVLDWRLAARMALLLQGLGLAAVTQAQGFIAAGLAFLCISLGGGAVYSLVLTVLSDHHQADRVFGYSITAQVAFQVAGLLLLSQFTAPGGFDRLMWDLLALVAIGLVMTAWLPRRGVVGAVVSITGILRQGRAALALLGCLFFFFNVGCIWAYVERIGALAGFGAHALGNGMALGVSVGMAGSLSASWQGNRFGRVWPLALGAAGTVLAVSFLLPVMSLAIFVLALALYNFVWNYSLAYQYAVVAAADKSGRCVAVAPAFHAAGGAMGPAVAALLVVPGNFLAVNVLAAVSVLVSLALFLPVARRSGSN